MPKAPKAKHTSRAMKARSLDPRYVNVSFRIALGLSTSDADVQEFTRIKKALRELVERHYDYNLSEKEQKDDTREAFAAEIAKTMPQLHATEQTRKETDAYVARHFTNVSWLFRSRKSAPREDPSMRLALEDDKDDDDEDVAISACRHPGPAEPDLSSSPDEMSQTNGSRHENAEPMVEDDKDKDVDAPVNVPIRRRPGRPRKNFKAQAKHTTGVCQEHAMSDGDISMSFIPLPSTDSFQCPTTDSPPSYMIHSEEHEEVIRKFLRSCMPNLEHLLPVFIRIGLEERRDLEGALNWPAKERVSWLMELSKEEWGISRMNVKSLSLAFDVTEQYEATLVAMGADK